MIDTETAAAVCGRVISGLRSMAIRSIGASSVVAGVALVASSTAAWSQSPPMSAASAAPRTAKAAERSEQGARWAELKPAQRSALKPLENDWAKIDAPQKQKWLELSARFPAMSADERVRVQARMSEWAKLTPPERGQARLRYQEAKSLPAIDRQARWNAYQALPAEERQQLTARAKAAAPSASSAMAGDAASKAGTSAAQRPGKSLRESPQAKSNVVPNPAFAVAPVPITPTVVQAKPGVTTTPISRRPSPPSHQQAGLPKIAATPEFVDKATLLPQRGPQGAATRPAAPAPAAAGSATRP